MTTTLLELASPRDNVTYKHREDLLDAALAACVPRNEPSRSQVELGMTSEITMYGADWCSDCRRSKKLLDTMGITYNYIDVEAIETAADEARAISGRTNIPVVTFPDGTHFVEPSDADLRAKLESLATS